MTKKEKIKELEEKLKDAKKEAEQLKRQIEQYEIVKALRKKTINDMDKKKAIKTLRNYNLFRLGIIEKPQHETDDVTKAISKLIKEAEKNEGH